MADRNKGIFRAGIGAGIIGGIVMAAFAMMYGTAVGVGFWTPLRLIAATTNGVDALIGGGGVLLRGLMIHMVMSAIFGLILAGLFSTRRVDSGAGLGIGLVYGAVIWAGMTYIALPLVNSTMLARISLMQGAWFFEHLLYGVVTGALIPAFQQRAAVQQPAEVRTYSEHRAA